MKIRMFFLISLAGLLTTLCNPFQMAQAGLISFDDTIFGPDSITRDTDTGLEWLDWTVATGLSYEDMISQLGLGGEYYGFRYATLDEAAALFDNGGLGPQVAIHNWFESPRTGVFGQLIDMLGVTSAGVDHKYSTAILADDPAFPMFAGYQHRVHVFERYNSDRAGAQQGLYISWTEPI